MIVLIMSKIIGHVFGKGLICGLLRKHANKNVIVLIRSTLNTDGRIVPPYPTPLMYICSRVKCCHKNRYSAIVATTDIPRTPVITEIQIIAM